MYLKIQAYLNMTPVIALVTSNHDRGVVESFMAHAAGTIHQIRVGFDASPDEKELEQPSCEVLLLSDPKIKLLTSSYSSIVFAKVGNARASRRSHSSFCRLDGY